MRLMVYNSTSYKEYYVKKNKQNSFSILIKKEDFELNENVEMTVVIKDGNKTCLCDNDAVFVHKDVDSSYAVISETKKYVLKTSEGAILNLVFSFVDNILPRCEKYYLPIQKSISIGSSEDDTICFVCNLIEKSHALIQFQNGKWLFGTNSKMGGFINGRRIIGQRDLHFGDVISLFGLKIVYFGSIISVSCIISDFSVSNYLSQYDYEKKNLAHFGSGTSDGVFNRPPRVFKKPNSGKIKIEAINSQNDANNKSLFQTIGRSLTMTLPMIIGCVMMTVGAGRNGSFMALGIITAVTSAVIGALWALFSLKHEQASLHEKEKNRFFAYGNYLISVSKDLSRKYRENYENIHRLYPSTRKCANYDKNSVLLWNRNINQEDFLFVRLGIGNLPFQYEIEIPKKEFAIVSERIQNMPSIIKSEYKTIYDVPIGIDFGKNRLVGISCEDGNDSAVSLAYTILCQLSANICYSDLKIVLLNKDENIEDWDFLRWLPHCWSQDRSVRYYTENKEDIADVSNELLDILRIRANGENSSKLPFYFVVITNPDILENNMLSSYLLNPKEEYGFITIILSDFVSMLPNECSLVVKIHNNKSRIFDLKDLSNTQDFVRDVITKSQMKSFISNISNIKVVENNEKQSIPANVDFLSMYNVGKVSQLPILLNWKNSKVEENMSVPIGVKSGNTLCYLDIHEKMHGPHGLVAGTTGSGKSETLQSYILSLCVNFSPEDVTFFIIDYKGGGMANLFESMPHVVGQISNLSGNQIKRAMTSIRSESLRRQRLFSEYGVNSINQYTQLYKSGTVSVPIAHLIIIIDEFAELKRNESDFMSEIISIAQVGRSLGIHLILATQKPGGTVDDNIRSNSKFRLCLRVQDRQDSIDMLHRPDASYITRAGEGILQVGNDEIFEPFQSAWSGKKYDEQYDFDDSTAKIINNSGKSTSINYLLKQKTTKQKNIDFYYELVKLIRQKEKQQNVLFFNMSEKSKFSFFESLIGDIHGNDYYVNYNITSVVNLSYFFGEEYSHFDETELSKILSDKSLDRTFVIPSIERKTQLEAIREYIGTVFQKSGIDAPFKLWLPELPKKLLLSKLSEYYSSDAPEIFGYSAKKGQLEATIGLVDNPSSQSQFPLVLNFAQNGNHIVMGAVSSGKSTLIQTILYSLSKNYTPEQVNFYIVDFSSGVLEPFSVLPHTGGLISEREYDKADKLFFLLNRILKERKELLHGGNFNEYVSSHEGELPAIFLVIDNFAGFKEKTEGKYDSQITYLSREGNAYGIFLIVSCASFSMADMTSRLAENFKTVLTLELADRFKYIDALHTTSVNIIPEANIQGRGLVKINGQCLEYQTALVDDSDNEYERSIKIKDEFQQYADFYHGYCAEKIPEIPKNPTLTLLKQNHEYLINSETEYLLPIGYNEKTASVYSIDLRNKYCYVIVGQTYSKKENILSVIMSATISKKNSEVILFSKKKSSLNIFCSENNIKLIDSDEGLFEYFKSLTPEFVARNKEKQNLIAEGLQDEELYPKMNRFHPVFFFIDDLNDFFNSIYKPEKNVGNMIGFAENIFEKGIYHNIYFFGYMNTSDNAPLGIFKAYSNFTKDKKGLLMDTPVNSQRIFDFSRESSMRNISANANSIIVHDGSDESEIIVIPNANR